MGGSWVCGFFSSVVTLVTSSGLWVPAVEKGTALRASSRLLHGASLSVTALGAEPAKGGGDSAEVSASTPEKHHRRHSVALWKGIPHTRPMPLILEHL